jgi:nucleotide-binding universal stress UspA family protein
MSASFPGRRRLSRPVLVGYDATAAERAPVEFGIAAARSMGVSRMIVCVYATPAAYDRLGTRQVDDDLIAQASRMLDEVEDAFPTHGLTIECREVSSADIARALHEAARSTNAALLVVGARRKPRRALPGSLVERVMHGVACPIAVVPYGWDGLVGCKAIGAAYVDSTEGREALRAAAALARRARAKVHVITAFGADPADGVAAVDAVQRALAALERDVPVEATTVEGSPVDVLVGASRHLDVLVVGSRRYGQLRVVSLGEVCRRVALEAHCPVIVLPRQTQSGLRAIGLAATSAPTAG